MATSETISLFTTKAKNVSAVVVEVPDMQAALAYALDVCDKKEFCQLLLAGCEQDLSDKAASVCERATNKTLAAPLLPASLQTALKQKSKEKGFTLVQDSLRNHLTGIDVGISLATFGIAETGTCVVVSASEELRLATMIAEVNVMILQKSKIAERAYDIEQELDALMQTPEASFTAFITGPSRTADIERVLAIGVHGPLELHIALVED